MDRKTLPSPLLLTASPPTRHRRIATTLGQVTRALVTAAPLPLRAPARLGLGLRPSPTENLGDQVFANSLRYQAQKGCTVIFVHTYVDVQSFLCTPMCVYSHYCANLCAFAVIFVHTYMSLQSFLCTLMCVYSPFCANLCGCTVIFVQNYLGVQLSLCTLMCVYSHFCAHLCACKVIFCTLMWVKM